MTMLKKIALLIFSVFLIGACSRTPDFSKGEVVRLSIREPIPADTLIKLERTECYGTCPVYTLTITADGTVVYEGKRFVKSEGRIVTSIAPEQLREILSAIRKANYFSMKDRYASGEDGCEGTWTDHPSVIISVKANGRSKTIHHDHGCEDKTDDEKSFHVYPQELYELENKIDEIVGSEKWVKTDQR
jgi:hypothetical protein